MVPFEQRLEEYDKKKKNDIINALMKHTNICEDLINCIIWMYLIEPKVELKEHNNMINLTGIDLSYTKLTNIKMYCCNLSGANFTCSTIDKCCFRRANMSNTTFVNVTIHYSDFFNAYIKDADWSNSIFHRCNFSSASIINTNLSNSDCTNLILGTTTHKEKEHHYGSSIYLIFDCNLINMKTSAWRLHQEYPETTYIEKKLSTYF
jgi:uncharacterized protein YjbI with pentapeptide repeats